MGGGWLNQPSSSHPLYPSTPQNARDVSHRLPDICAAQCTRYAATRARPEDGSTQGHQHSGSECVAHENTQIP